MPKTQAQMDWTLSITKVINGLISIQAVVYSEDNFNTTTHLLQQIQLYEWKLDELFWQPLI
jgi:hypothetical protein